MKLLSYFAPIVLIIGIVGAIFHWKSLKVVHKFILIFFSLSLFVDVFSRFIMSWLKINNNLSILSLYLLIEFLFLAILYNKFLPTKKSTGLLYTTLLGGFVIISLALSKLAPIIPTHYQMYEGLVANFFTLFFGLYFIYKILVDDLQTTSQLRGLNSIVIMYAGIQFFMALTINFMVNMQVELVFTFWLIRLLALTIFYSKLAHILWKPGKMVIQ